MHFNKVRGQYRVHEVLPDGQTVHMYFLKGKYSDGTTFYYVGLYVNGSRRQANDWFEGKRKPGLNTLKSTGRSLAPLGMAYRIMTAFMSDVLLPGQSIEVGWSDDRRKSAYKALKRLGFQLGTKGEEEVYFYKK